MFNPLCNSKINNVLRDGGAGRIESKTLTFDGNTDGKFIFGGTFVKVADEVADLSSVVYLSWFYSSDGAVEEYTDGFQVDSATIPFGDVLNYDGNPWVLIVHENAEAYEKGTYFYCKDGEYVSVLKTETIHQIDPKYLPGVCLPVVEFSTTLPSNNGVSKNMDAEESAKLDELASAGLPFVAKIGFFDGLANGSFVMNYIIAIEDDTAAFIGASGTVNINLQRENGVWIGLISTIVDSETE